MDDIVYDRGLILRPGYCGERPRPGGCRPPRCPENGRPRRIGGDRPCGRPYAAVGPAPCWGGLWAEQPGRGSSR